MNMKAIERNDETDGVGPSFKRICLASCRRLLAQIESAKNAILAEFRNQAGVRERMLRLALNEAEALAWQTEYPHLVFPTLATEKAGRTWSFFPTKTDCCCSAVTCNNW